MSDDIIETPEAVEASEVATPEPEITLYTSQDLESAVAAERTKWEASLSESLAAKNGELASLRSQFDSSTIAQSLADAARAGKAVTDELVVSLLRGHTSVIDGRPVVQIEGFQLSPQEAIQWMRSQPSRYGALFWSDHIPGIGGHSTASGYRGERGVDVRSLSPAQYRELKRMNPGALGFGGEE